MNRILYFECYSGISGDMIVASLLDLGADQNKLVNVLNSLSVKDFEIDIKKIQKSNLTACDFEVKVSGNYDHDMEYLYGKKEMHHHKHEHRSYKDIIQIIESADMTDRSKSLAKKIFQILAEAESKVHNSPVEEVHFHEVGAVDSIVDIISAAVCLDDLNISDVAVSELYDGKGFVKCQHGLIPIPVPAVSAIAAANNLDIHIMNVEGEYVTPTGAAVVAAVKTRDALPKKFRIERIGLGAGKRETPLTGILRTMIITEESAAGAVYKLECNVDDCSGEVLGHAMTKLFEAGARDVHYTPAYMKKNRPGYQLNVICREEDITALEEVIFRETTTIGIRKTKMEKTTMECRIITIPTPLGDASVKICSYGSCQKAYPEYESVVGLCRKNNVSYSQAYYTIQACCLEHINQECLKDQKSNNTKS